MSVLLAGGMACGDEGTPDEVGRRDVGGGAPDATVAPPEQRDFVVDVVAGLGSSAAVGDYAVARANPDGRPAVAFGYYSTEGSDPIREIRLAELDEGGTWSIETVVSPAQNFEPAASNTLRGLGFDYVDGQPHVAYLGGDNDGHPAIDSDLSDLALSVKSGGTWQETILSESSAEATGECFDQSNYCVQGVTVGLFPTLRAGPGPGEFVITHRDEHFLGFGSEDSASADLELYGAPSGRKVMVDGGRSAGNRSAIAYLPDGRVAVAYTLDEPETEVWVAVEDGDDWSRTRVSEATAIHRLALDATSDGTLWLAYFDRDTVDLAVASSTDDGETWALERVEERGDVGLHPTLAVGADDTVFVAYTYCGSASDRDCPGTLTRDSEVRLATRPPGAAEWTIQRVSDNQGQGFAGLFNSLVVLPDGRLGVAFSEQRSGTGAGDLLFAREVTE
jgi:hypothetical protein